MSVLGRKQITLKDIAKALDLSPSTVSRSLKDHPGISAATKEMVQEYAREHKYKPNALALSLRTKKSNTIGVIIPEIVHYFFSSVLSGIEEEAEKSNYKVLFCQSNENYEREIICTQTLLSASVCGVLVSVSKSTTQFQHFQEIIDSNIPMVFFDRICTGINTDKVVVDDYTGAFNAVEYLINTNCKRIVLLGGNPILALSNNRRMGYEDALRKHKIPVSKNLMFICDTIALAQEIIPEILRQENRPDAFFAINDEVGAACINIVNSFGLKIPDDISICGFTNNYISQFTSPNLTSVDQRGFEVGSTAARLLINRLKGIENKEGIVSRVIKTKLVVKDSTRKI